MFIAVVSGNLSAAEALLADDIEWDLMPTGQKLKGKAEVMPWLRAGAASRKEPVTISGLAAKDWGHFRVLEYRRRYRGVGRVWEPTEVAVAERSE